MHNKAFRSGPIALTNTLTTNILNPATATGGVNAGSSPQYLIIKHIRVVNKTSSAASVSLWLGLTGANTAGTEFAWGGFSVPANSYEDWYGLVRIDSTDFIVGGSGSSSALVIDFEGEVGVAG